MTSRERFQAAMAHRQPDGVPIDIGGTSLTGMRPSAQKKLAEVLGFRGDVPRANHGFDERIMEWAGTDFRSVGNLVNLPSPHSRRLSDTAHINYWGRRWELLDGEWQLTGNPLATVSSITNLRPPDGARTPQRALRPPPRILGCHGCAAVPAAGNTC